MQLLLVSAGTGTLLKMQSFFFCSGLTAILVRQTSVVWILLLAVGRVEKVFKESLLKEGDLKPEILRSWRQIQVL